jgi:uncharacterized protein (TIGR03435 family)
MYAWFLLAAVTLPAQSFEVVSIKPAGHPGPLRIDAAQVVWSGVTLRSMITQAYNIAFYQLDAPGWLEEPRYFGLSARIPDGASKDDVPKMLQTMLADRFALKAHWESREQPVYALVVGKGGPKFKTADLAKAAKGPDGETPTDSLEIGASGHIAFRYTTLPWLARFLSHELGRPVLDLTGIQGTFDFEFDANPSELDGLRRAGAAGDSLAPSLFTGIETLGLKLESRKAPIAHLVVDSASRTPTGN